MTGSASTLVGQIYDFSDLTTSAGYDLADDAKYTNGVLVCLISPVSRGGLHQSQHAKADVTFDNYLRLDPAPAPLGLQGTPQPVPDMPQVANRTPEARANFIRTRTGSVSRRDADDQPINTGAIKLFLNSGVSSGLAMSGSASNVTSRSTV